MPIINPFLGSMKFAATIGDGTGAGEEFVIDATAFIDDNGEAVTEFPATFAYYVLYLNGMPQTGDVSTLTTESLTIPDGNTLNPAVPVIVEVIVN